MKTLYISDCHGRISWVDKYLLYGEYDNAIIDGDIFDWFYDSVEENVKVAKWIKKHLDNPKLVWIAANHQIHYAYPNILKLRGSGYSDVKSNAINKILTRKDWDKFKFYHYQDGWLISHAGLHDSLFTHPQNGFSFEYLDKLCQDAIVNLGMGKSHFILEAGLDRGGSNKIGGLIWLDMNSFQPIEGINQIFGHSEISGIRQIIGKNSINYCVDTQNRHIFWIKDGEFSYEENKYLKPAKTVARQVKIGNNYYTKEQIDFLMGNKKERM